MGDVYTDHIVNDALVAFLGEQQFEMACEKLRDCYAMEMRRALEATGLREQLAAKDAEIAELRDKARGTDRLIQAINAHGVQLEKERDEARECVKGFCETLTAIRDSTCTSATTLRGHAGVALAATPEHLRGVA